ncbi:V/A-type H+-transporting ATPase subunit I [Dysgonomonadaceae bacterium PH5-43]|nr:V/A-type H+-transporting ATPase subunit I [Dysgonomonadaceae bacterium PH5-43]
MIEKMKKYSFLIYYKDYDSFLEKLRSLGVVHVIETDKGVLADDVVLQEQMLEARRVKSIISDLCKRTVKSSADLSIKESGSQILTEIEQLKEKREKILAALELSRKELERMAVWGDFDFTLIDKIKNNGYYLEFYSCPASKYKKEWESSYNAIVCKQKGGYIYFVTLTKEAISDEVEADKVKLAQYSYTELLQQQDELNGELLKCDLHLDSYAATSISALKKYQGNIYNDIDLSKVKLSTSSEVDNKVMFLEGWVPVAQEEGLLTMLKEDNVLYQMAEPTQSDNVPILLRNNKFAQMFEAIGEMYSLPNYNGWDMTILWAPFYTIFFGICLGDAGYGLLLTLVSLIMLRRVADNYKSFARLGLCLGISTIIFGTLCGTFFGVELMNVNIPILNGLKTVMIDSNQLFTLSLVLGAIQLSFAMIVKGIKETILKGFRYSLDTWGWLMCLLGNGITFALSNTETISTEIATPIYIGVNIIAFTCMLLLNNPEQNILKNIGGGLWGLYNKLTGILGDILSYIRLFALGISGAVMGLVFNQLAISISADVGVPVVSQIILVLILLIGHAMNIFISGLSAFVHPMRLTFVEFYNNAGFESGGKKYIPFKNNK